MNTRLLKEARQLLPAWVAALLLASVPMFLFPAHISVNNGFATFPFALGVVVLSVSSFGREFSQRTFALFVVQPVSRERLWWEKVSVQAASMISVVCVFVLSWKALATGPVPEKFPETLFAICVALAAFGGGLLLTLLLRQILAAIFLTVLLPIGIGMAVAFAVETWLPNSRLLGEEGLVVVTLPAIGLTLYGLLTFAWARVLFLRAQDAQWTGGNVTLPGALKRLPWIRTATTFRTTHPLRALCWKEFQFHQVTLLLAVLLLVFSIAMLALPKFVEIPEGSVLGMAQAVVVCLWLVIPLLVGCNAVAEERKLGTLEAQLCLPVSRARQFTMKAFVTLLCGLVLGPLMPMLIALGAWRLGLLPAGTFNKWDTDVAQAWLLMCAGITLVALYASTLTRHLLQAFGATIALIALVPFTAMLLELVLTRLPGGEARDLWLLHYFPLFLSLGPFVVLSFAMAYTWSRLRWLWTALLAALLLVLLLGRVEWHSFYRNDSQISGLWVFGSRLSEGSVFVLGLAPIALLLLVLGYRNFRHTQTSGRLWLRNAGTWAACLLATTVVTTLVYNRVWEVGTPFEPPAGPARLSGPVQPVIAATGLEGPTFVLLPDGRLCFYQDYERVSLPNMPADTSPYGTYRFSLRKITPPRAEFIGDSNWVSVATARSELIGVKSDGSLWNAYWSEWVARDGRTGPIRSFAPMPDYPDRVSNRQASMKLERIGDASDWMAVAAGLSHFVALKRDGTLWGWGDNDHKQLGEGPKEITAAPVRISSDSDWTAVFASYGHTIAVKRDGSIWKWGRVTRDLGTRILREDGLVKLNLSIPGVRTVISTEEWDLILDTDGNLWGLGRIPWRWLNQRGRATLYTTAQKLAGSNWTDVRFRWGVSFDGLKNDGSLWSGVVEDDYTLAPPARRLGKRTDWLAAASERRECVVALARDGTLCQFGKSPQSDVENLLAPVRRVTWSINVLDLAKSLPGAEGK